MFKFFECVCRGSLVILVNFACGQNGEFFINFCRIQIFFARIEKFNIYEKFSASVGTQNMLRQNRKVMMMMSYVMEIFVERKFENQVFLRQVRTCMNLVL